MARDHKFHILMCVYAVRCVLLLTGTLLYTSPTATCVYSYYVVPLHAETIKLLPHVIKLQTVRYPQAALFPRWSTG